MLRAIPFLVVMVMFSACAAPESRDAPPADGAVIRDTASVVSVDDALGQVVLNLHGKQVNAFFETELVTAQQSGLVTRTGPRGMGGPVGIYKPTITRQQTFLAKPGDTISFIGIWMGDQIYLRGVAVEK